MSDTQRPIKFRAWNKTHGYMTEDISLQANVDTPTKHIGHQTVTQSWFYNDPDDGIRLDDDWVVMQFTGLTDKNGIEIFEGDLIRHNNGTVSEVKARMILDMGKGHLGIPYLNEKTVEDWFDQDYEVIGNIYSNPNLISTP